MKRIQKGINDLETWCKNNNMNHIIDEWDSNNNELTPKEVAKSSHKKVWWKCKKNHKWFMSIDARTGVNKCNCPICANRQILYGYNDLETWCKNNNMNHIIDEWDTNNNELTPKEVTKSSNKKVWWKCKYNHNWKATISSRTNGNNCPKCNLVATSFPEQAIFYYLQQIFNDVENRNRTILKGKELDIYIPTLNIAIEYDGSFWHKDKRKDIEKDTMCKNKNIRLIHIIENNFNEFNYNKMNFETLSYHYGNNKELSILIKRLFNYLNIESKIDIDVDKDQLDIKNNYFTHQNQNAISITHPNFIKEWDFKLNKNITPNNLSAGSHIKVWWNGECGHKWKDTVYHRILYNRGCPYCSGKKVLYGFNDLETWCKNNKKEYILNEWDIEKNKLNQNEVYWCGTKTFYWKCKKGHSYTMPMRDKTKSEIICPYCDNRKALKGYNDLETLKPELLKYWDYNKNGDLLPSMVTPNSSKKVWWICDKGHSGKMLINQYKVGSCPICHCTTTKKVMNIDTGIIYKNCTAAAKSCGLKKGDTIGLCCTGKQKTAGGFHWEYVDDNNKKDL